MLSLDEKNIRASFLNASRKEVADLTLPTGFDTLEWADLDYLGWRDPRIGRRAYVIAETTSGPAGILLRQADALPRARAQCSWCQDVHLPNDVVFWSARRAGPAGRNGGTVGTLICSDFECSVNVRRLLPPAYLGFDAEAVRTSRIETLRERAAAFVGVVLNGT